MISYHLIHAKHGYPGTNSDPGLRAGKHYGEAISWEMEPHVAERLSVSVGRAARRDYNESLAGKLECF
jgi:hypothetical protein